MRAVIVQNEMHPQSHRHRRLDRIEELAKLHRAVAAMQPAYDFSRLGVQSRKQRGRAMAPIVMTPPLRLSGTHREHGLAAVHGPESATFHPGTAPALAPAEPD